MADRVVDVGLGLISSLKDEDVRRKLTILVENINREMSIPRFKENNPSLTLDAGSSGTFIDLATLNLEEGEWDVEGTGVLTIASNATGITFKWVSLVQSNESTATSAKGGHNVIYGTATGLFFMPTSTRQIIVPKGQSITVTLRGAVGYSTVGSGITWSMASYIRARRISL